MPGMRDSFRRHLGLSACKKESNSGLTQAARHLEAPAPQHTVGSLSLPLRLPNQGSSSQRSSTSNRQSSPNRPPPSNSPSPSPNILASSNSPSPSSHTSPQSNVSLPSTQAGGANASSSTASPSPATRNLWAEAFKRVSPKQQAGLRQEAQSCPSPGSLPLLSSIDELCALTEQKRAECEKRGWRVNYSGQEIILRDVVQILIRWLNKFKQIGDVAVNYDPVHASLPWAGIRFLLQCAVADSQQTGDLLVGAAKVTYLVSRCKIYETLYIYNASPGRHLDNLQNALVELYASILRFLASANRLYDKKTAFRAIHAVLNPDEVKEFIHGLQSLEQQVDIEAGNCQRTYSHEMHTEEVCRLEQLLKEMQELREPILRTDNRVADLWTRSTQAEHLEILCWTSDIKHEETHKTASDGRTAGTGQWLLTHPKYCQWRESRASTILWLHGIPGAGKTKLASKVVDDMLGNRQNTPALAYFYCDRNQTKRQDPMSVLRSFVRQLSTTQSGDAVQFSLVQLYNQKKQTGFASGKLDRKECENLLLQFVNNYSQTTLVLDALDECAQGSRKYLVNSLKAICESSSKPIKIFISSREDADIKYWFESGPHVGIQATDNEDDIGKFVAARIDEDAKDRPKKLSCTLKDDIVDTLLHKSKGMFQWASLQISQLLELDRERDIRLRLGKLPVGLDKAYDEIYEKIINRPGSASEIAKRAFQWVMSSVEPLSPTLLVAAACQDPDTDGVNDVDVDIDYVLNACCNLLVVDLVAQKCRFSHLSVQEYLETRRLQPIQAQDHIAKVSLRIVNDSGLNGHDFELSQGHQALEWDENTDVDVEDLDLDNKDADVTVD